MVMSAHNGTHMDAPWVLSTYRLELMKLDQVHLNLNFGRNKSYPIVQRRPTFMT
jgi:kynurenine formamidase